MAACTVAFGSWEIIQNSFSLPLSFVPKSSKSVPAMRNASPAPMAASTAGPAFTPWQARQRDAKKARQRFPTGSARMVQYYFSSRPSLFPKGQDIIDAKQQKMQSRNGVFAPPRPLIWRSALHTGYVFLQKSVADLQPWHLPQKHIDRIGVLCYNKLSFREGRLYVTVTEQAK